MHHVFFHRSDLDGHCAGALCRFDLERRGEPFRMVPSDYGDRLDFSEVQDADEVWLVDFVPNDQDLVLELASRVRLTILDHHQTTRPLWEALQARGQAYGMFRIGTAACELAHPYLSTKPIPPYVQLLGRYDTWRQGPGWEGEVLPFQFGLRSYPTDPATDEGMRVWQELVDSGTRDHAHERILHEGQAILRYQKKQDERVMEKAFETEFEGLRALVNIGGGGGSTVFRSRWDPDKHDVMVSVVNHQNRFWTVSLYTEKDLDLTPIAKKYGGGGHAKACGFQTKELERLFPLRS